MVETFVDPSTGMTMYRDPVTGNWTWNTPGAPAGFNTAGPFQQVPQAPPTLPGIGTDAAAQLGQYGVPNVMASTPLDVAQLMLTGQGQKYQYDVGMAQVAASQSNAAMQAQASQANARAQLQAAQLDSKTRLQAAQIQADSAWKIAQMSTGADRDIALMQAQGARNNVQAELEWQAQLKQVEASLQLADMYSKGLRSALGASFWTAGQGGQPGLVMDRIPQFNVPQIPMPGFGGAPGGSTLGGAVSALTGVGAAPRAAALGVPTTGAPQGAPTRAPTWATAPSQVPMAGISAQAQALGGTPQGTTLADQLAQSVLGPGAWDVYDDTVTAGALDNLVRSDAMRQQNLASANTKARESMLAAGIKLPGLNTMPTYAYAQGGKTTPGRAYIVGENAPEVFIQRKGEGEVVPLVGGLQTGGYTSARDRLGLRRLGITPGVGTTPTMSALLGNMTAGPLFPNPKPAPPPTGPMPLPSAASPTGPIATIQGPTPVPTAAPTSGSQLQNALAQSGSLFSGQNLNNLPVLQSMRTGIPLPQLSAYGGPMSLPEIGIGEFPTPGQVASLYRRSTPYRQSEMRDLWRIGGIPDLEAMGAINFFTPGYRQSRRPVFSMG